MKKSIQQISFILLLIFLFTACQEKVLMRVYNQSESVDEALKQFSSKLAENEVEVLVGKYFDDVQLLVINGDSAAKVAGYENLFENIRNHSGGYILNAYKIDEKQQVLLAGTDDEGTILGLEELQKQIIKSGFDDVVSKKEVGVAR